MNESYYPQHAQTVQIETQTPEAELSRLRMRVAVLSEALRMAEELLAEDNVNECKACLLRARLADTNGSKA